MTKKKILELIKSHRKSAGLTQKDMADKLDVERSQYTRYELGKNEIALDKLLKIGEILGLEIDVVPKDENDLRQEIKAELAQQFIDFLKQKS